MCLVVSCAYIDQCVDLFHQGVEFEKSPGFVLGMLCVILVREIGYHRRSGDGEKEGAWKERGIMSQLVPKQKQKIAPSRQKKADRERDSDGPLNLVSLACYIMLGYISSLFW